MQNRLRDLFDSVAVDGATSAQAILDKIELTGVQRDDRRLSTTVQRLLERADQPIDFDAFTAIVADEVLMLSRIFQNQLVIPDWQDFRRDIHTLYTRVAADRTGANADYIPILRDADPEPWGVAMCTVDGQRLAIGDVDVYHSIQSVSKPITYAHALTTEGEDFTHRFVGVEPSGRPFDALDLLPDHRPFNPCVNAGAIVMAGLVASRAPELDSRQITQQLMDLWSRLSGGLAEVRFSEETMLSERATADTNYAIAYLLRGRLGLPRDVDLQRMMDVYLSCCSIEMTTRMLAIAAATLANGGVCPISGVQVLSTDVVKRTLTVMQTAGMYDNAGTFSLEVGLPAKSGVAGAVLVVVPNLMGLATFSPRLDSYGNSVRGVRFCRELVEGFTFHQYDSLSGGRSGCKHDPRESQAQRRQRDLRDLRWGALCGDRTALRVRDLLIDTMVALSLVDGAIEDPEMSAMGQVYGQLMGSPPELDHLRAQVDGAVQRVGAATGTPFELLLEQLRHALPQLDDNARGLILEAAFRVACADGAIGAAAEPLLRALAVALAIPAAVLELEIARFRAGPSPVGVR
jgi:glutaminase